MAKTIVTDSDTIQWLSYPTSPVAEEVARTLKEMKARGDRIVVTQQGWHELVEDPALLPRTSSAHRELLKDYGIEMARPALAQRVDQKFNDPQQRGIETVKGMGVKDATVALQAKDLGAEIYSVDRVYRTSAPHVKQQTGAVVSPEVARIPVGGNGKISPPSAPKDYRVARARLGLEPIEIDGKGVVTRRSLAMPPPGTAFRVPANIQMQDPVRVNAVAGGIQIAWGAMNYVLAVINDEIQRRAVDKARQQVQPSIEAQRDATPHLGIAILYYYRQTEAPMSSVFKPGKEFAHLEWGKGATIDEARQDALKAPSVSPGTSIEQKRFWMEQWIPPKSAVTVGAAPFKPIRIGKFVARKEEIKFQGVKFDIVQGFDDTYERTVNLAGLNIEFVVLDPPSAMKWFDIRGGHTMPVAVVDKKASNGKDLKCANLDTLSPFSAVAAMVFPKDEQAWKIFQLTSQTVDDGLLGHYVNFRMVRWVRPENIEITGVL